MLYILLRILVSFCSIRFSSSVLSQVIGWEEPIWSDLFCDWWDVKPQLNQWVKCWVVCHFYRVRHRLLLKRKLHWLKPTQRRRAAWKVLSVIALSCWSSYRSLYGRNKIIRTVVCCIVLIGGRACWAVGAVARPLFAPSGQAMIFAVRTTFCPTEIVKKRAFYILLCKVNLFIITYLVTQMFKTWLHILMRPQWWLNGIQRLSLEQYR